LHLKHRLDDNIGCVKRMHTGKGAKAAWLTQPSEPANASRRENERVRAMLATAPHRWSTLTASRHQLARCAM
jgi:hypothetical protein